MVLPNGELFQIMAGFTHIVRWKNMFFYCVSNRICLYTAAKNNKPLTRCSWRGTWPDCWEPTGKSLTLSIWELVLSSNKSIVWYEFSAWVNIHDFVNDARAPLKIYKRQSDAIDFRRCKSENEISDRMKQMTVVLWSMFQLVWRGSTWPQFHASLTRLGESSLWDASVDRTRSTLDFIEAFSYLKMEGRNCH